MKPDQPCADLPALAATDKESLSVQTKGRIGVSGCVPADHFRGVTKMIAYGKRWASDRFATRRVANSTAVASKATPGKPSIVQTEGARVAFGHAASDHFCGITKLIGLGNHRRAAA